MRVSAPSEIIRFGVFEVDLHTQELRKQGFRIHLVGQPFEVLAMLLERPSELVTREEFKKRLWSGDTFVDFEHGLNTAVKKLREALGDDAEMESDEPPVVRVTLEVPPGEWGDVRPAVDRLLADHRAVRAHVRLPG